MSTKQTKKKSFNSNNKTPQSSECISQSKLQSKSGHLSQALGYQSQSLHQSQINNPSIKPPLLTTNHSEIIYCSKCAKEILKSAYQYSCDHIICILCLSRDLLQSSLLPLTEASFSSQMKVSCCKCTKGHAEINLNSLISLLLLPNECLQHGPLTTCIQCTQWYKQLEQMTPCSYHTTTYSTAFCKTCQVSICPLCIDAKIHSNHTIKVLSDYQAKILKLQSNLKLKTHDTFSIWLYDQHKTFNALYESEMNDTITKINNLIETLHSIKKAYISRMETHKKNANDAFDIIYFMYYYYYKQLGSKSNEVHCLKFLTKMKQQIDSIDLIKSDAVKDIEAAQRSVDKFLYKEPYTFNMKISFINAFQQSAYTLYGHQGYVFGVICLDKKTMASCSEDKDIRIWDYQKGECVKVMTKSHSAAIYSLCRLKHKQFASGSFAEIKIWDRKTYAEKGLLTGHCDYVVKMRYLKKGNLLASSSNDKTIKIWDILTKKCLQTLIGHEGYVNSFVLLKRMERGDLASVSFDKTIRVWNRKDDECLFSLTAHDGPIYSIIQLRKEKTVMTGSYADIKIWDLDKKECLRCIIERNTGVYDLLQFKNNRIASCSFQTINIWDLTKEEEPWICSLNEHTNFITCLILMNKKILVSASDDKTIKIWD